MKWLWLATRHVSTESNVADIGTKGRTSDSIWKLLNLMGMSLVAGVGVSCAAANGDQHGDVES